jgi:hypothetical protein
MCNQYDVARDARFSGISSKTFLIGAGGMQCAYIRSRRKGMREGAPKEYHWARNIEK